MNTPSKDYKLLHPPEHNSDEKYELNQKMMTKSDLEIFKRDISINMTQDVEITRMKEKCKSYENEVLRLRQVHENETNKLKSRIKNLEKLVKTANFLTKFFFGTISDLKSKFIEVFESLDKLEIYNFSKFDLPPKNEEMIEFIQSRRVFKDINSKIQILEEMEFEEENKAFLNILEKFKEQNFSMKIDPQIVLSDKNMSGFENNLMKNFKHEFNKTEETMEIESIMTTTTSTNENLHPRRFQESEFFERFKEEGNGNVDNFINFVKAYRTEAENIGQEENGSYEYISKIQEKVENVIERKNFSKDNYSKLQNEIKVLSQIIEDGELEQEEARNQYQKLEKIKGEKIEILKDLQTQKTEIMKEIVVFQEEIEKSDQEVLTEMENLNQVKLDMVNLECSLEMKSKKLSEVQEEIKKREKEYMKKENELEGIQSEEEILKKDIDLREEDLDRVNERLIKKLEEIKILKEEIGNYKLREDEVKNELEEENSSFKEINEEFERVKNCIEELEIQLKGKQNLVLEKNKKCEECLKIKEDLLEKINSVNHEFEAVIKKTEEIEEIQGEDSSLVFVELKERLEKFDGFVELTIKNISKLEEERNSNQEIQIQNKDQIKVKLQETQEKIQTMFSNLKSSFEEKTTDFKNILDLTENIHCENYSEKIEEFTQIVENLHLQVKLKMETFKSEEEKQNSIIEKNEEILKEIEIKISEFEFLNSFYLDLESSIEKLSTLSEKISLEDLTKIKNINLENFTENLKCVEENTQTLLTLKEKYSTLIQNIEDTSLKNNEKLNKKLESEKELISELNELQKNILFKRQEASEKLLSIGKLEGKIELLQNRAAVKTTILGEENEFLLDLENTLLKKTAEFQNLNNQKQEDVFSTFKEALADMTFMEKSKLLNLLLTLVDLNLSQIGVRGKSLNNTLTDFKIKNLMNEEEYSEINSQLFNEFKELLLSNTSLTEENVKIIEENFSELKSSKEYNFKRILSNFMINDDVFGLGESGNGNNLEGKQWRNSLKYTANLVSYMMKTSSFFINIYAYFIKDVVSDINKKAKIKNLGKNFSEEIFKRHREIIDLVKNYEDEEERDIKRLSGFIKSVSEYGKAELKSQENYLKRLRVLFTEEKFNSQIIE